MNLEEEETRRHDEIIEMTEKQVLALDLSKLTDLELWAAAQVLGNADNPRSDDITDRLIAGKRAHPAIDYLGLAVDRCYDHVIVDNLDASRAVMQFVQLMSDGNDDH